jgi:histone methylation protein DOT1
LSTKLEKLRSSLRKRGLWGTARTGVSYALEPVAPYHPKRLAKRFADWCWDLRHDVETSTAVDLARLRIDAPADRIGYRYQATSAGRFHQALASVPIRHQDFVFIDFGSGKGKCLLMASDYPFRKAIGVEFSAELADIARNNVKSYRSPRQKCRELEIVACDATTYQLPSEPGLYYFYNPFKADLMRVVRENIRRSIEARPRQVYVLYYNPAHREVFDEVPWLKLVKESPEYCVYVNHVSD